MQQQQRLVAATITDEHTDTNEHEKHVIAPPISVIANKMIEQKLASAEVITDAYNQAIQNQQNFISYLITQQILPAHPLATFIATAFTVPFLDLDTLTHAHVQDELLNLQLVSKQLMQDWQVLPVAINNKRLQIAMSDPSNIDAINAVTFYSQLPVDVVVAEADKLQKWIKTLCSSVVLNDYLKNEPTNQFLPMLADEEDDAEVEDAPVVKYINQLLIDAVRVKASDLHFEPYEHTYRIRYRLDGILQTTSTPPIGMASKLTTRLKVMAKLNIAERRLPQDGRTKFTLTNGQTIDFRVSTLPTLFGEKIVLRILDATAAILKMDQLGLTKPQQAMFEEALRKPQGMILITGPTGSGKTVSLYTGLHQLNTEQRNIATAEDPVEIYLEGINQVNINPAVGLTFASALRSFLRQDPDILMVGEMRDLETAQTAIKAAQTGHLVLSTLHTNSACQTLTRLRNMGVASFNVANAVSLVIAQRLVRKLCSHCKSKAHLPASSLLELGFTKADVHKITTGEHTIFEPVGCKHCRDGYKGRVGIFEVLAIDTNMATLIMQNASAEELKQEALKNGFMELKQAAILTVLQGTTSLQEINRVT